nr:MAG TPA: hypothetical protein [Caudoviricetes sp.]
MYNFQAKIANKKNGYSISISIFVFLTMWEMFL